MSHPRPATVGQLKETGYRPSSVKDELRRNVIRKLKAGEELFPGIVGYRDTRHPADHQRHSLQARPAVPRPARAGQDAHPAHAAGRCWTNGCRCWPAWRSTTIRSARSTKTGKRLVAEQGDDAKIEWVHRSDRYHEKLATPDVTIADLIGEIDLVKHAEGRYLSDESTMHFGLIPRSNRGIFAINELPDLAPRIQVGLVQRAGRARRADSRLSDPAGSGRLPGLQRQSRGLHQPRPDRDAAEGPHRLGHSHALSRDGGRGDPDRRAERLAGSRRDGGSPAAACTVDMPRFMSEIVEEVVRLARSSPHVSQASGVSVRTSIANLETVVSNAERRGILTGEKRVVPRICDLNYLVASCRGQDRDDAGRGGGGRGQADPLAGRRGGEGGLRPLRRRRCATTTSPSNSRAT